MLTIQEGFDRWRRSKTGEGTLENKAIDAVVDFYVKELGIDVRQYLDVISGNEQEVVLRLAVMFNEKNSFTNIMFSIKILATDLDGIGNLMLVSQQTNTTWQVSALYDAIEHDLEN